MTVTGKLVVTVTVEYRVVDSKTVVLDVSVVVSVSVSVAVVVAVVVAVAVSVRVVGETSTSVFVET